VEDGAALEQFLAKAKISECQPALYFQWDDDSVRRIVKGLNVNRLLKTKDLPFDLSDTLSPSAFCEGVINWISKKLGTDHFKHILLTSKKLKHVVEIKKLLEYLENLSVLQEAAHLYLPRKARLAHIYVLIGPNFEETCSLGPSSYLPDRSVLFE
jgi:hypothetical protein